ncbi:hypothetical protein N9N27_04480 [Planktomarina sp.]|nr:hypothetical protein [Planktomarina sp.]
MVFLFWIATRGKNMKRILLTTTSLVLAAGVAQADITFSGATGIALIDDNGASSVVDGNASIVATNAALAASRVAATQVVEDYLATAGAADGDAQDLINDAALAAIAADTANTAATRAAAVTASRATRDGMFFESYYDFNVTASAESDNGISVSVGFDMGAGNMIDYNDDDVLEAQGNDVGDADVAVSYGGWTLKVDQNGIDNLFDDSQAGDMQLSGSLAGMSVAVTTDQENDTNSYKVSGTVGGIALTATGTDNDDNGGSASKIAASYAMGDLTLKASVEDESLASGAEDDTTVGLSYAMDTLTVGYTSIKPGTDGSFGDEWDFSIKYAAGAVAASFATDESDATTIILDYNLGGGASAFAAMHDKAGTNSDLTAIGLNFAF